jgi:hypothetical protein
MACTLASGIGIHGLQVQVDQLEDKAIKGEPFTDADKAYLKDLYTCFARGARLTIVLRQSAQLMDHYLAGSGEDLRLDSRIFLGSKAVMGQMEMIKNKMLADLRNRSKVDEVYSTDTFYMADPDFFESFVGLYYGKLIAHPRRLDNGRILLNWRAEMPWQWPTYESLKAKQGNYHAQSFPLPNARSILQGPKYSLYMDDGLGEHLARLGLAKPFLVYSEWEEQMSVDILAREK